MSRPSLRTAAVLAAVLFFAAVLWRGIATETAVALLMLLAAAGTGGVLRIVCSGGRLGRRGRAGTRDAPLAFDLLTGYPIAGTLFFLAGCISTAASVMLTLLVALAAIGAAIAFRSWSWSPEPLPAVAIAPLTVIAIVVASAFVVAQGPAFSVDELAYHLAVPKIWVLERHVVDLPLISHSYFPFGTESLDIAALSILGDRGAIASHLAHLAIACATGALLFFWMRRRASAFVALGAVAAMATTPVMVYTAGFSWNDWPLAGVTVALLVAIDEGNACLAGIAIAAGLLTKYSFVAPAAAIVIAGVIVADRSKRLRLAAACAIGGIGGSVFFVRNLIFTGNPFSPVFDKLSPAVEHFRSGGLLAYVFDTQFADEALGIGVFLLVAIGAFSIHRGDRFVKTVFVTSTLAAILLIAGGPSSRILVPALFIAGSAAAVMIDATALSVLLVIVAAVQALLGAFLCTTLTHSLDLLMRRESEVEYLSHLPVCTAPQWVSAQLPPDSRTLVAGLTQLFWFERRVRGGGNFDGPRVSNYIGSGSADDFRKRLAADGISYVAIFAAGLAPQSASHRARETILSPQAIANLREVLRRATLVARAGGIEIYRLR